MGEELAGRGRSSFFGRARVAAWKDGTWNSSMGGSPLRATFVAKKEGTGHRISAQVTDRSTERALHAVFHDHTFNFDISGYDWFKQLVRRVLGEVYFGSKEHFQWRSAISLDPLLNLAAALSAEGIPGLQRVELQWLAADLGIAHIEVGTRNDCMKSPGAAYVHRLFADGASPAAAALLLYTSRARPLLLKIDPPKLVFDRRDPRLVKMVYAYLVARGFHVAPRSPRTGRMGWSRARAGESHEMGAGDGAVVVPLAPGNSRPDRDARSGDARGA